MTKNESRLYEQADEAEYMMAELERHLHGIRYDPSRATPEDIRKMNEVLDQIGKSVRLAKEVADRIHG